MQDQSNISQVTGTDGKHPTVPISRRGSAFSNKGNVGVRSSLGEPIQHLSTSNSTITEQGLFEVITFQLEGCKPREPTFPAGCYPFFEGEFKQNYGEAEMEYMELEQNNPQQKLSEVAEHSSSGRDPSLTEELSQRALGVNSIEEDSLYRTFRSQKERQLARIIKRVYALANDPPLMPDLSQEEYKKQLLRAIQRGNSGRQSSIPTDEDDENARMMVSLKRCNQTKYVRKLLGYISMIAVHSKCPEIQPGTLKRLRERLEECTKVQDIQHFLNSPQNEQVKKQLSTLVLPGTLYMRVLQHSHYPPMTKYILLDSLGILRFMVSQPNFKCSSWRQERVLVASDFSELAQRLLSNQISLRQLKAAVQQSFRQIRPHLKKVKCSAVNNINHFLCKLLADILKEMLLKVNQFFESPAFAEIELTKALKAIKGSCSREKMMEATSYVPIRKAISRHFVANNRMLAMIASRRHTSTKIIKHALDRYQSFVDVVTRPSN